MFRRLLPAVLLLAAISDGPLGASKLVSRPLHRWCDIAVAIALVVVAIVFWSDMGVLSAVTLIGTSAVLVVLVLRTDYRPKVRRRLSQRLGVDDLVGTGTWRSQEARPERIGRIAGRLAARAASSASKARRSG